MQKEVLIALIEHLARFDQAQGSQGGYGLSDFVGYLNTVAGETDSGMRQMHGPLSPHIQTLRKESHSDVSILLTLLFRYAKHYTKKALENSLLQTVDEFGCLVTLISHESLTKTALIQKQALEKPSGIEVIKRLIAAGLIKENKNTEDKRSVNVSITAKGKKEIQKILPKMALVSKIVVGNLSIEEIHTLTYLMKKLDWHHFDLFVHHKDWELDQYPTQ